MKANVFGIKMEGSGLGYSIIVIALVVGLVILLPFVVIWTANQMFRMGWNYTVEYWFGALVLLFFFYAICQTKEGK
jgi:hypothetical protein